MKKIQILIYFFLFIIKIGNAQYTNLLNFNGINGRWPQASLTLSGNVLYGMTQWGGTNQQGNVFSINSDGSGFIDLFDFNGTNGKDPMGSLTLSGNVLYGMTKEGGANGFGTIFSINTNGSGYTNLMNFDSINGSFPYGDLTISNSVLYGMTHAGGAYNNGTIFSINTDGSGYIKLLDFNGINGSVPYGSLTLSGNVLYGTTNRGGPSYPYGAGNFFSINTDGTGFVDLFDFNSNTNAAFPVGTLLLSGNVLYGMADGGPGPYNFGTIYSIHSDGSGYSNLFYFDGTNGATPGGSLIISGNVLYGMVSGRLFDAGKIFSLNTDGSDFNVLLQFNSTNAGNPEGSLTLAGNVLYGMTVAGGANNDGVIFSYNLAPAQPIDSITANFTANKIQLCAGGSVNYTDSSIGNTTNWNWTFEGGTPGTSTLQNPTVMYAQAGTYYAKLVVSNSTANDSVLVTSYIAVSPIPVVDLGNDTMIVAGTTLILDAGNSGSQYVWNNASTNQTISVSTEGTYSVIVTNQNGCYGTDEINIVKTFMTSAELIDNNNFLVVYPNPAKDIFTISYQSKNVENLTLTVSDSNGKRIYTDSQKKLSGKYAKTIDLSKQSKGTYYIELIADGKKSVEKVILN
jgi:uncharacterized repeat protein (TIGR03803 family)